MLPKKKKNRKKVTLPAGVSKSAAHTVLVNFDMLALLPLPRLNT
jgi:hypothetical protein